jgi:LPS-assembly protein
MLTAGVEIRWPFLLSSTPNSTHVLEPIAQSLRCDRTKWARACCRTKTPKASCSIRRTLFERDKFTGYDRMEGGHRANFGLRYTGTFNNATWTAHTPLFGQSYHLGGSNSFASADYAERRALASGLESECLRLRRHVRRLFREHARISAACRPASTNTTLRGAPRGNRSRHIAQT